MAANNTRRSTAARHRGHRMVTPRYAPPSTSTPCRTRTSSSGGTVTQIFPWPSGAHYAETGSPGRGDHAGDGVVTGVAGRGGGGVARDQPRRLPALRQRLSRPGPGPVARGGARGGRGRVRHTHGMVWGVLGLLVGGVVVVVGGGFGTGRWRRRWLIADLQLRRRPRLRRHERGHRTAQPGRGPSSPPTGTRVRVVPSNPRRGAAERRNSSRWRTVADESSEAPSGWPTAADASGAPKGASVDAATRERATTPARPPRFSSLSLAHTLAGDSPCLSSSVANPAPRNGDRPTSDLRLGEATFAPTPSPSSSPPAIPTDRMEQGPLLSPAGTTFGPLGAPMAGRRHPWLNMAGAARCGGVARGGDSARRRPPGRRPLHDRSGRRRHARRRPPGAGGWPVLYVGPVQPAVAAATACRRRGRSSTSTCERRALLPSLWRGADRRRHEREVHEVVAQPGAGADPTVHGTLPRRPGRQAEQADMATAATAARAGRRRGYRTSRPARTSDGWPTDTSTPRTASRSPARSTTTPSRGSATSPALPGPAVRPLVRCPTACTSSRTNPRGSRRPRTAPATR